MGFQGLLLTNRGSQTMANSYASTIFHESAPGKSQARETLILETASRDQEIPRDCFWRHSLHHQHGSHMGEPCNGGPAFSIRSWGAHHINRSSPGTECSASPMRFRDVSLASESQTSDDFANASTSSADIRRALRIENLGRAAAANFDESAAPIALGSDRCHG